MPWSADQISWLGITEDLGSEGDILTVRIGTPSGVLSVMGEIELSGRVLFVRNAHIQSEGGARSIGLANLRLIAGLILERIDCDEARVEGAVRTTGANPGHRPRVFRYSRNPGAASV